jgi:hypothetical protein
MVMMFGSACTGGAVLRVAGRPATVALRAVHSGLVGDYVAWLVAGLAMTCHCRNRPISEFDGAPASP